LLVDPRGPFEPQFGPGSRERHVAQAERRGLAYAVADVASLGLDLDTGEDLEQLVAALADVHGRAARTRGVLSQIGRARTAA
jgi:2-phospho-L-lactate guanylyltransferase